MDLSKQAEQALAISIKKQAKKDYEWYSLRHILGYAN